MGRKEDPRVPEAFWYVSQGNIKPSDACRLMGIARTSLYRYEPFIKWRTEKKESK